MALIIPILLVLKDKFMELFVNYFITIWLDIIALTKLQTWLIKTTNEKGFLFFNIYIAALLFCKTKTKIKDFVLIRISSISYNLAV